MPFKLGTKTIQLDTPFTHNDIQYPANWIRLATEADKSAKPASKYPTSNVKVVKKTKTTKPKKMSQKEFNKREWAEYKYQN